LTIDFHSAYKPDGMRRTWPNLITREGVMGLVYSKWRARITPDHSVMLPLTRMLAGRWITHARRLQLRHPRRIRAAHEQANKPMMMGARAYELALYVVFESGFQMALRLHRTVSFDEHTIREEKRVNVLQLP
jgi:alpha-glucosidase